MTIALRPDWPVRIFVGPSGQDKALKALKLLGVQIAPPIARGNLERAVAEFNGQVNLIIVDGVFFGTMSVSIMEIRDALKAGAVVVGASSMGALRAVECSTIGMLGYGRVYRWLRLFAVEDDDEVAQILDGTSFQAVSHPMVDIRALVGDLRKGGHIDRPEATEIITKVKNQFFAERTIGGVVDLLPPAVSGSEKVRNLVLNFVGPKTQDFLDIASVLSRKHHS